ncbi:1-phosphofructokinase family hexose kinase [Mycobacterium sp. SM1]|uniref:1-phosphofructokinase family hexose kinase n=1 Tax=Mycobacterium sp. SM1 TaxID=2816243 RepID=UPI001BCCBBC4|nr:1-phosphofructokinase family hexose kinase [Mycobacterium sp. SM1]MBS4729308.1 1-phosphofructokinase family hexose kinase [Mycobacterium sp. SM1]
MKAAAPPPTSGSRIVTLTMNPALDITTTAERVCPTEKIRCHGERYDAGGGGINVARVAQVLGASVSAVFPAGGQTGEVVVDLVARAGVRFHRIKIAGATRECFTVNESSSGRQYRFVLPGPRVSAAEQARCLDELRSAARSAQFVVASGSLPPGVPARFYQRVADMSAKLGALLVLDTSGGGLRHITSGVFLLKASVRELRECFGRDLDTESAQTAAAQQLIRHGRAQAVVVSLGSRGALLATAHGSQRFSALPMRSGSGVGAGDAMVAAITVGLSRGWPMDKAVRYGIAAGAAMLMTPGTAACNRADVDRLFETVPEPTPL